MANNPDYGQLFDAPDQIFTTPSAPNTGSTSGDVLRGIAKTLGSVTSSFDDMRRTRRQETETARQARIDKEKADKEATSNAWARGALDLEMGTYASPGVKDGTSPLIDNARTKAVWADGPVEGPNFTEIKQQVGEWGRRYKTFEAARLQGRLPGVAKEALVDQFQLDMMNRYPGQEATIMELAKSAGLPVFNNIEESNSARKNEFDSRQKARTDAAQVAASRIGPIAETLPFDQLVSTGHEMQRADWAAKIALENAQEARAIRSEQRTVDAEGRTVKDYNDKNAGRAIQAAGTQQWVSRVGPLAQEAMKVISMADGSPDSEKRVQEIRAEMVRVHGTFRANIMAQARVNDPAAAEQIGKDLDEQFQNMFLAPLDARDQGYAKALGIVNARLGLNAAQAFPFLRSVQAAGIRTDAFATVLDTAITNDPSLAAMVSDEVKGIAQVGLTSDTGILRLNHLVSILNGNDQLRNLKPQDAARVVQTLSQVGLKYGQEINRGKTDNTDYFLTSIGTVVNASTSINRQSSPQAKRTAALAITGNGQVRQALRKTISGGGPEAEEAKTLVLGTRAAAAGVLADMRASPVDGYYHVVIHHGYPELKFDAKAWNEDIQRRTEAQATSKAPMPVSRERPQPSQDMRSYVAQMQGLVDHLVETSDLDPNAPKGGTTELRQYYVLGIPTNSMRKEGGKAPAASKAATFDRSANTLLTELRDPHTFDLQAPDVNVDGIMGTGGSVGERNNNHGNIKDGAFAKSQSGYVGRGENGFARFETPAQGTKAQENLLTSSYINRGFNTVTKVIEKYAPRGPENSDASVNNYIAYVAKRLNINPQDTLTPVMASRLAQAMREFETGNIVK